MAARNGRRERISWTMLLWLLVLAAVFNLVAVIWLRR